MSMTDFDAHTMLVDMGICPICKDHTPCGCEWVEECESCGELNTEYEFYQNDGKCYNCNSPL